MNYAVILPVLNPDEKFTNFVQELVRSGFETIVVVNDGSSSDYDHFYDDAAKNPQVIVLKHEVNRGKGAALKTAFAYLADNRVDIDAAITCDGDGQHSVASMKDCLNAYEEHEGYVIIGGRDFDDKNIPSRSRFGNKVSSFVYKFACGIKLKDTQTGLRVIPARCFESFSALKGDRYEYETNMLIEIVNRQIPYLEIPIETIYIDDNASSHFNPFKDSMKIYGVILRYFIKFIISSIASWVVDIGVYAILEFALQNKMDLGTRVLICTIASRVVSSVFNYILNRKGVFKSVDNVGSTAVKYYILAICQMGASYGLVYFFTHILHVKGVVELIVKCVVDLCLFIFSYNIQRRWVFKNKK
jgi:glycosyltransferase involved in cell wall biosynthesis